MSARRRHSASRLGRSSDEREPGRRAIKQDVGFFRGVVPEEQRGSNGRLVREGAAQAALVFDGEGKECPPSFLVSVIRAMFEQADFTYVKANGKDHCVTRKVV